MELAEKEATPAPISSLVTAGVDAVYISNFVVRPVED